MINEKNRWLHIRQDASGIRIDVHKIDMEMSESQNLMQRAIQHDQRKEPPVEYFKKSKKKKGKK